MGGTSRAVFWLVLLLALLFPPVAFGDATSGVTIRTGNHPDFGRVVFDTAPHVTYRVVRDGDRLTVQFAPDVTVQGSPPLPRNVSALHADGSAATLVLAPGSTIHETRLGEHVVIDVFDPAAGTGQSAPPPQAQHASAVTASAAGPAPAAQPPVRLAPAAAVQQPVRLATDAVQVQPSPVAAPAPLPPPPPLPSEVPVATFQGQPPSQPVATSAVQPSSPVQPVSAPQTASAASGASPSADTTAGQSPAPGETADAQAPQPLEQAPLQAQPVALPQDQQGAAFSLPLPADSAAAVYQDHGQTLVVFDRRQPLDLSPLQAVAAFASARAELLPAATVLHLAPPAGTTIALAKTPQGWTVAAVPQSAAPQAVAIGIGERSVSLDVKAPGKVVSMPDASTGARLLIGTQSEPGQAVLVPYHTPQFDLLPTTQGVVVYPRADTVTLRPGPTGLVLATAPAPLWISRLSTDMLSDPAVLTRRFDFPNQRPEQLTEQLAKQIAAAADQPLLDRGPARRAAAVTMISLGMDAEAEALLQLTATDDPRQAASTDLASLTGIAALLAGRPAEAGAIDDPRVTGTDEIELWRALLQATRDEASPGAAAMLVSTASLLLTYPPAIRDKVLPLAAETMVQGGATAAARELLMRSKSLPGLDLAQAMLSQAEGNTNEALARYDALAAGRDQFVSARAAVRAVDLRLSSGKIDQREAAEALDRLLYAWRGDHRELALREKLATLRQGLGEWRQALALLRDSETLFPDDKAAIHARLQQAFDALLQNDAADGLPPLEFVSLIDENADLVPNTQQGDALDEKLADKLLALDLPDRAAPVLDKLMRGAPAGPGRASIGLRLATLHLHEGDASGALATLDASESSGLPAPLNEQRSLLRASAQAQSGNVTGAVNLLAGLDSAAAVAETADILERAQDWRRDDKVLAGYVAKNVPPQGGLSDEARHLLLRLATAASKAGDEQMLAALRARDDARMGTGPLADMFRLLTAGPVRGIADLAQSQREVGLAKTLPSALEAMQPRTRTP